LPLTVEPPSEALGAPKTVTPVVNAEDLDRGFKKAGM